MKKISTLIAMLLLLVVGGAQAQRGWEYTPTPLDEILPGEDHFYVLQQGFSNKAFNVQGFLNSGDSKVAPEVNHSCIYNFIEVGTKESNGVTYKVFVLKNLANGKYLTPAGDNYTSSVVDAFNFTARKAREVNPKDPSDFDKTNWELYSNAVSEPVCQGAEANGAWVLCHTDHMQFISIEKNPGFNSSYIVGNNWQVFTAKEKELSAYERFSVTYNKYLLNGINEEMYPVGDEPGCVSQELYNKMLEVSQEANEMYTDPTLADEKYDQMNELIQQVFEEYKAGFIHVAEGYYSIMNKEKGLLGVDEKATCNNVHENPAQWDITNAKYIWKVEPAQDNSGRFYLKNISSTRYLSNKAKEFKMTEEPIVSFTFPHRQGTIFYINDGDGYLNAKKDGNLTHWADLEGIGNHWTFTKVPTSVIDSLSEEIEQNQLNQTLTVLVDNAQGSLKGLEMKSGLTMDGFYAKRASGLVQNFVKCNATDTREGSSESAPFDGNVQTFYHTKWSMDAPANVRHWAEIDFGEPVQELYIKMTKRLFNHNSNPTRIALMAATDDHTEAYDWDEEVYEDTVIYTYPTELRDTIIDSTTFIKKITLTRPVQHVRFTATRTVLNKYWNEGGPAWNINELRFYKAENCVHNPYFDLIPKEILNKLETLLQVAKAELKTEMATQATIDTLQTTLDEMWESYPNPNELIAAINNAQAKIDCADESTDEPGYFKVGAKATLQTKVDNLRTKAEDESHALTLDEIANLQQQLEEALHEFYTQLILPPNGFYRLRNAAVDENENPINETDSYIATTNADERTFITWAYKNDTEIDERLNTIWALNRAEDGTVTLRNLANGLFINNPYEGLSEEEQQEIGTTTPIAGSKTEKHISLQAAPIPGQFMLALKNDRYVNASGQAIVNNIGRPLAIWNDFKNGTRSRWMFDPVEEEVFSRSFMVNTPTNKVLVMSFPIDINGAYLNVAPSAYKVLGVKDGHIQLKLYDAEETIPAGTPFIVSTGEEDVLTEIIITASSLNELLNSTYKYEPVVQNGLVSAIEGFEIEAGYGMVFNGKVIPTVGGEKISAGTGFFNKQLPATTEEGTFSLELTGEITGESTAVEHLVIQPNVANNVYTLSGVMIRQNVKGSAATKGLPKGVYIVGGKKVIVK